MKTKSSRYLATTGMALLLLAAAACGSSGSDDEMTDGGSDADASATAGTSGGAGKDGSTADTDGGGDDGGTSTGIPTVVSTLPRATAEDVPLNAAISVTFSEVMDPDTLGTDTFVVTAVGSASPVEGTVICADSTAVFWPAAQLASDTSFSVTISTDAKSASGVALERAHSWRFSTGDATQPPGVPVNLRSAGNFVILAKSAISTVPTSAITGNIGVSPAAASYITGFAQTAHSSNVYATAPQVIGKIYAANYTSPTPSNMTTAIQDMELAFTDAAARAPDATELGAGDIGGMTLQAGVYKWGTGLLIPTNVTLTGSATDVWIFQIAQNLTVSNAKRIKLAGGALAKNVFWQVAGKTTIGTTAHLEGSVLCKTSITLRTGASINGRLLAQTAVVIDGSIVTQPAL